MTPTTTLPPHPPVQQPPSHSGGPERSTPRARPVPSGRRRLTLGALPLLPLLPVLPLLPLLPLLPVLLALLAPAAMASGGGDRGHQMPAQVPAAYQQECAACHMAYPPGLLPARSWQRLMGGLEHHFGTDATLDAAAVQQLSGWLQANAGTDKRVSEAPPEDRITRSVWFARKHDGIAPSVWQLPSVKSAANCAACHTGAERGRFDDDHLKFPAGLDARSRRAWND